MSRRLVFALCALLGSCAARGPLQEDYATLVQGVEDAAIDEYAERCAPRELALAHTHKDFTELEFDQGDARRAEQHLDIATTNIAIALEKAEACRPKDKDGDGLMDHEDQCPEVAETFNDYKDDDGCPETDTDKDGIWDDDDKCVMEPEDLDGFMDNDGCPDLDNDNDGLVDSIDKCPNQAEIFNGIDDEDGCPDEILDSDGDGLNDDVDQCPQQPENFNEYLDEDGCPDTKPQNVKITKTQIEINDKILFASGKATILPVSYDILNSVSQVMKDYPKLRVRVEGHTDSDGGDSFNLKLSQARAESVVDYLVKSGVMMDRLEPIGFGETRPVDTNRTKEGKANNRRVEFHIIGGM